MKIVAGLGNPGKRYEGSRHNLGFRVVDQVAQRLGLTSWKAEHEALIARGRAAKGPYVLVKPQTFMNLSGRAVGAVMRYYRVPTESCLAVVDDLNLDPGRVRARQQGSDGGHNGLRSLSEQLGGQAYKRIRIGIGRPPDKQAVTSYVLGGATADEAALTQAVEQAAELVLRFLETDEFDNWSSS